MEFQEIFLSHLSRYITSNNIVINRLSFLISLFQELRSKNIKEDKEMILSKLKVNFVSEDVSKVYEVCLLRDLEKAIQLTSNIKPVEESVEEPVEEYQVDSDREAIKNREVNFDLDFLKSVGYEE